MGASGRASHQDLLGLEGLGRPFPLKADQERTEPILGLGRHANHLGSLGDDCPQLANFHRWDPKLL